MNTQSLQLQRTKNYANSLAQPMEICHYFVVGGAHSR